MARFSHISFATFMNQLLTEVIGHVYCTADQRWPIFGSVEGITLWLPPGQKFRVRSGTNVDILIKCLPSRICRFFLYVSIGALRRSWQLPFFPHHRTRGACKEYADEITPRTRFLSPEDNDVRAKVISPFPSVFAGVRGWSSFPG